MSCTTAEVCKFIPEYQDLPLAELAVKSADHFVTDQLISDAMQALNNFSREHNEPLRQAVATLQSLADKALMASPVAKHEVLCEHPHFQRCLLLAHTHTSTPRAPYHASFARYD